MEWRQMELRGLFLLLLISHTYAMLQLSPPSTRGALAGSDVLLSCNFWVNNPPVDPKLLTILWYFENQTVLTFVDTIRSSRQGVSLNEQAARLGDASLSITNVSLSDGGTYKCLVIYSSEGKENEITLEVQAQPRLTILNKVIMENKESSLLCLATGFYPPDIEIVFLREGEILSGSLLGKRQLNPDGTYNVYSSLKITPTEEQRNQTFSCRNQHPSLQQALLEDFQLVYGDPPMVKLMNIEHNVLQCLITGFYSTNITVRWLRNGDVLAKAIENLPQRNEDGTFNVSSTLVLSPCEMEDDPYIVCQAENDFLQVPLQDGIKVLAMDVHKRSKIPSVAAAVILTMLLTTAAVVAALCFLIFKKKYFRTFRVSHIHRPEMWSDENKVTLCSSASDCAKEALVTWTVTESDGNMVTVSERQDGDDEERGPLLNGDYILKSDRSVTDGLHNVITTLSFTPDASKHKSLDVVCRFDCDGKSKEEHLHWEYTFKKPELVGPIKLTHIDSGEMLCSVSLKSFYPKHIQITWSCGAGYNQELEDGVHESFTENSDETFNVQSECKIPEPTFNEPGFKVLVTWKHLSLDTTEQTEWPARDTGFPWSPAVGEITKPLCLHNTEVKLQCKLSGCFLADLDVKWLKREARSQEFLSVSPGQKYKIPVMDVNSEANSTFPCTASLIVTVSVKEDLGVEYICRMEHPSLERPLERSTGPLRVIGIPVVKNITQYSNSIILEVDGFYPQGIMIQWARAEGTAEDYKDIHISQIQNQKHLNSDSSYRLTSRCEVLSLMDKLNTNKTFIKAKLEHEALQSPIEINILRENGVFYEMSDVEKKHPLPEMEYPA